MSTRTTWVVLLALFLATPSLAYLGEESLLYETFQSISPPALPVGWSMLNVGGDAGRWMTRPIGGVPWGVQCLRYRSDALMPADDWVFTSAVTLTAGIPCGIRYMVRSGVLGPPQILEILAGTAPAPGAMIIPVKPLAPVVPTTYAADSVSFVPPVSGVYYVGFHVSGPPGGARLNLDDIRVTRPETGLRLALGLSKEIDKVPLVFSPNDTIETFAYIENTGPGTAVVNRRFAVGRFPSDAELDFVVTGPAGRVPILNLFEKLGEVEVSQFTSLVSQDVAGKVLNLWSWYSFDLPGVYVIEARYHNDADPGGLGAWRGTLVSDPVTITIQ
jgi:hypothetical protein